MPKKTTTKQAARSIKTSGRITRAIAAKRAGLLRKVKRPTAKQIGNALAFAAPGREAVYGKLTRVSLMLDAQSRAELRRVGGGSASDGARRLARHSAENELQGTLSLPERALARKTAP